MTYDIGTLALGFGAGVLSILSPCVLPLLPLIVAPAAAAHRWGVAALVAGLVVAFVAAGLFVATIGFAIGLDGGILRNTAAIVLGVLGVVLLSGPLQRQFERAAGGASNAGNRLLVHFVPSGWGGQFLVGALIGLVWSPCVGPTLGAASLLAAQGRNLPAVGAVMVAFGLGTAVPLVAIGSLSREVFARWRSRLLHAGAGGKYALGGVAVMVSALILTGADRAIESALVAASPDWLVTLTTRF